MIQEAGLGEVLVRWEVDEYPKHQRSALWFTISGIIGIVLIIYAIVTANFIFAVIILMIGVIMVASSMKEPDKLNVVITNTGIVIGDLFYSYVGIRDFSLVYNPPHTKLLYLDFVTAWRPMISVPLENVDPNEVRERLIPFCIENLERSEERIIDIFRRRYKL
ncbi:MAG: hypothetical protein ABIH21_05510 [Patescibacteria group bacterium]